MLSKKYNKLKFSILFLLPNFAFCAEKVYNLADLIIADDYKSQIVQSNAPLGSEGPLTFFFNPAPSGPGYRMRFLAYLSTDCSAQPTRAVTVGVTDLHPITYIVNRNYKIAPNSLCNVLESTACAPGATNSIYITAFTAGGIVPQGNYCFGGESQTSCDGLKCTTSLPPGQMF